MSGFKCKFCKNKNIHVHRVWDIEEIAELKAKLAESEKKLLLAIRDREALGEVIRRADAKFAAYESIIIQMPYRPFAIKSDMQIYVPEPKSLAQLLNQLQSALKERDEALAVVENCLEVFKKEEWKEGSQIINGQIVSAYWFCDYCRARRIDGVHKKDCQNPFLEPLVAIQALRMEKI